MPDQTSVRNYDQGGTKGQTEILISIRWKGLICPAFPKLEILAPWNLTSVGSINFERRRELEITARFRSRKGWPSREIWIVRETLEITARSGCRIDLAVTHIEAAKDRTVDAGWPKEGAWFVARCRGRKVAISKHYRAYETGHVNCQEPVALAGKWKRVGTSEFENLSSLEVSKLEGWSLRIVRIACEGNWTS